MHNRSEKAHNPFGKSKNRFFGFLIYELGIVLIKLRKILKPDRFWKPVRFEICKFFCNLHRLNQLTVKKTEKLAFGSYWLVR